MRKDEEVMNMLARELSLYDSAVDLFEKQLLSCGIKRNGSKVTMDLNSQSRSGTSLLADAIQRKGVRQKEKQLHLLCVGLIKYETIHHFHFRFFFLFPHIAHTS
jgi:hypothetical protein